ncbi:MAG: hypothetical protein H0T92_14355 [Pyrinomonadaceae bacterium]|nr:hypothetical protein [Pyrinomonadaceae bacterium]
MFDRQQDERYPVDGGIFDVKGTAGEIIVPIEAKIAVREPTLFALTVERPGGVVVSSRERLLLTARVPESTSYSFQNEGEDNAKQNFNFGAGNTVSRLIRQREPKG